MAPVLEFSTTDKSIGLSVRPSRNGPEHELTSKFVAQQLVAFSKMKRHYAVFYEPQIDTGFPDIVIAAYNPNAFTDWTDERHDLVLVDLKVLHHLHFVQGATSEQIEGKLGISSKNLVRSLERLLAAKLVRWYAKQWSPRSLRSRYAITNLIAIEVKIKDWRGAFRQAEMNKWFASESYVLFPVNQPAERIFHQSEELGIGIYSMPENEHARPVLRSQRGSLPSSYASWLFNEWIGRRVNS